MFQKDMQPVIIKAMQLPIINFSTYKGYDGADILKVEFRKQNELDVLVKYCRDYNIKYILDRYTMGIIYCIFEQPDDVYALKID